MSFGCCSASDFFFSTSFDHNHDHNSYIIAYIMNKLNYIKSYLPQLHFVQTHFEFNMFPIIIFDSKSFLVCIEVSLEVGGNFINSSYLNRFRFYLYV